ncbi:hypothetical protein [[Phormidium] sp. ETS-05]|nr:hypothetical protein [[Phormidium] sp. ETS-05]
MVDVDARWWRWLCLWLICRCKKSPTPDVHEFLGAVDSGVGDLQ